MRKWCTVILVLQCVAGWSVVVWSSRKNVLSATPHNYSTLLSLPLCTSGLEASPASCQTEIGTFTVWYSHILQMPILAIMYALFFEFLLINMYIFIKIFVCLKGNGTIDRCIMLCRAKLFLWYVLDAYLIGHSGVSSLFSEWNSFWNLTTLVRILDTLCEVLINVIFMFSRCKYFVVI